MVVNSIIKHIWGFAKSKRMAAVLISVITLAVTIDVFLLAGRWTPAALGQGIQTGKVYTLWWFQLLVLLLLVNLIACIVDSTVRRLKSRVKHLGLWGSTLFHLGLAIVLVGTLATGQFRIISTIKLIQGEPKEISYRAITTDSDVAAQDNDMLYFALQEQRYELDSYGNVKDIYSLIAWGEQGRVVARDEIADRQQFSYRGIYMFPSTFGYAVGLTVNNPQGERVASLVIPMDTTEYAEGIKSFSKRGYRIDSLPYSFSLNFYPDIGTGAGSTTLVNKSFLLNNPGLMILTGGNNTTLAPRVLRLNESFILEGYKLTFTEVKPWTQLTAVYDPGAKWVFTGIIMAAVGLSLLIICKAQKGAGIDADSTETIVLV